MLEQVEENQTCKLACEIVRIDSPDVSEDQYSQAGGLRELLNIFATFCYDW